jgi:hypothetical protein
LERKKERKKRGKGWVIHTSFFLNRTEDSSRTFISHQRLSDWNHSYSSVFWKVMPSLSSLCLVRLRFHLLLDLDSIFFSSCIPHSAWLMINNHSKEERIETMMMYSSKQTRDPWIEFFFSTLLLSNFSLKERTKVSAWKRKKRESDEDARTEGNTIQYSNLNEWESDIQDEGTKRRNYHQLLQRRQHDIKTDNNKHRLIFTWQSRKGEAGCKKWITRMKKS